MKFLTKAVNCSFLLKWALWAFVLTFKIDGYKLRWGLAGIFFLFLAIILPITYASFPPKSIWDMANGVLIYLIVGIIAHFTLKKFQGVGFLS